MGGDPDPTNCDADDDAYFLVYHILYLPLWTFLLGLLLILFIHCIRGMQTYRHYDNCSRRNAHFKYIIEIMVGPCTKTYQEYESSIIIDLLDNQMVSNMTIQIPGTTIFNDKPLLTYSHPRENLRLVKFHLYRKLPIKDIKCVRMAHNCQNIDSSIVVYGLDYHDVTNGERRFFPIPSLVKHRTTQWALNTNFEAKNDSSFRKIGCDTYDPFELAPYPTYMDLLFMAYLLYGLIFLFSLLLKPHMLWGSLTVQILVVFGSTFAIGLIINYLYIKFIKSQVDQKQFETTLWVLMRLATLIGFLLVAGFAWIFTRNELNRRCLNQVKKYLTTPLWSSGCLTLTILFIYWQAWRQVARQDQKLRESVEVDSMKSLKGAPIEFKREAKRRHHPVVHHPPRAAAEGSVNPPVVAGTNGAASANANKQQVGTPSPQQQQQQQAEGGGPQISIGKDGAAGQGKSSPPKDISVSAKTFAIQMALAKKVVMDKKNQKKEDIFNEAMDRAFSEGSENYMKTRNANSISQYV